MGNVLYYLQNFGLPSEDMGSFILCEVVYLETEDQESGVQMESRHCHIGTAKMHGSFTKILNIVL